MILRPGAAPTCYTFVLLAVVISLASSQKGAKPQWANQKDQTKESSDNPASSNCSAEEASSYQCPTDKSCIPLDWIGDGENDCADGADESEAAIAFAANQNKSGKTVTGVDVDVPTTTTVVGTTTKTAITPPTPLGESKKGDPFSQIATKQPARTEQKTCSQQINKCSEQLVNWIVDLAKSNTSQLSVLHDQKSMSKIEEGCGLLPKYTMCMEKLAKSCVEQQPNQQLKEWLSMQMYMCELLVPSVKEHSSCFGAPRKAGCNLRQISAENSLMCSLVASAMADISCVEKMHKEECSETAVELIGPMKSETEHVLGDLNCSLPPSPTNISAEPENGEGEDAEVSAATQVSSTAQRVHPETSTTAAAPQTTSKAQESLSDLTNSLFSFGNVDLVCQHKIVPKSEDLWAPIRVKICARGDELKKYSQCFLETAKHEQSRCPSRLLKTTSCGAIDAFNKNIDCVVKSLNELCPVEAQDIVVEIQEKLNDEAISHKCYQGNTTASAAPNAPVNNDGFSLKPTTGRCSSDQENAALVCLVELIEINKQLAHFQSINFLLEISNPNSTVINGICSLYEKYEKCLDSSVFAQSKGQRCSFNSPLNTLARIGLSPVCGSSTRQLLFQSRDCLLEVSQQTQAAQCQSGLQSLGQTVQLMLQGIHGEALLCKSFYLLRNSFECGTKIIHEHCESQVFEDLNRIKKEMNSIGLEEGCPAEEPDNLNEIIAKPIASSPPQNSGKAPIARPIALTGKAVNAGSTSASAASNTACEPEEQKKFGLCVQPLTAFQPHPLAVIKQPKQIDEACQSFKNFNGCRQDVKCNPLWARGMSAMFDYACEDGYQKYIKVRQCIRRTTTRSDIRECVLVFSKGAPQEACQSSNRLLACALPPVTEKCGAEGVEFVQEYVRRFAAAIDPQCKIGEKQEAAKPITPINCTANEDQIVQHCAAPLNDIHSRIDELFEGGLQSFLKNVNNLAPVFAEGCNLTNEFRECARPILQSNSSCVVSSCLIRAGNGICEQPNVAAAIEENLGCVFKQVADTNFAKCLRSTISTLKTFNLEALRGVLPKFVECVEPIVLKSCGPVPLNVLKALSSSNICPVSLAIDEVSSLATSTTAEPAKCTAQLLASYNQCHEQFTAKYTFWPTSLINQSVLMDEMCTDLESLSKCLETSASSICEHPGKQKAIQMLSTRLCTNKSAFEQRRQCMLQMVSSQKGAQCLESFIADETSKEYCSSLNQSTNCLSEAVFKECPPETVSFIYEHTNEYLHGLQTSKENSCQLAVPSVSLQTGCSDQDLIQYLECEQIVDQFRFKPVAFISNSSKWNEFCTVTKEKYRPCMDALPCRFEPITGASLSLFESLCDREVTHRDQLRFAPCLSDYINTPAGKQCVEPFGSVDLLTRQAGTQLCPVVNTILNCSARAISSKCGDETLLHVYDTHNMWMQAFQTPCILSPPDLPATVKETGKENKPQFDFSHDTTTPSPTSPKTSEMGHQTEESTPEPEPSPEPQPSPEPEPSATTPQPEPQPTTTTPAAKGNGQKNQSKGNSASREHQHLPYTVTAALFALLLCLL